MGLWLLSSLGQSPLTSSYTRENRTVGANRWKARVISLFRLMGGNRDNGLGGDDAAYMGWRRAILLTTVIFLVTALVLGLMALWGADPNRLRIVSGVGAAVTAAATIFSRAAISASLGTAGKKAPGKMAFDAFFIVLAVLSVSIAVLPASPLPLFEGISLSTTLLAALLYSLSATAIVFLLEERGHGITASPGTTRINFLRLRIEGVNNKSLQTLYAGQEIFFAAIALIFGLAFLLVAILAVSITHVVVLIVPAIAGGLILALALAAYMTLGNSEFRLILKGREGQRLQDMSIGRDAEPNTAALLNWFRKPPAALMAMTVLAVPVSIAVAASVTGALTGVLVIASVLSGIATAVGLFFAARGLLSAGRWGVQRVRRLLRARASAAEDAETSSTEAAPAEADTATTTAPAASGGAEAEDGPRINTERATLRERIVDALTPGKWAGAIGLGAAVLVFAGLAGGFFATLGGTFAWIVFVKWLVGGLVGGLVVFFVAAVDEDLLGLEGYTREINPVVGIALPAFAAAVFSFVLLAGLVQAPVVVLILAPLIAATGIGIFFTNEYAQHRPGFDDHWSFVASGALALTGLIVVVLFPFLPGAMSLTGVALIAVKWAVGALFVSAVVVPFLRSPRALFWALVAGVGVVLLGAVGWSVLALISGGLVVKVLVTAVVVAVGGALLWRAVPALWRIFSGLIRRQFGEPVSDIKSLNDAFAKASAERKAELGPMDRPGTVESAEAFYLAAGLAIRNGSEPLVRATLTAMNTATDPEAGWPAFHEAMVSALTNRSKPFGVLEKDLRKAKLTYRQRQLVLAASILADPTTEPLAQAILSGSAAAALRRSGVGHILGSVRVGFRDASVTVAQLIQLNALSKGLDPLFGNLQRSATEAKTKATADEGAIRPDRDKVRRRIYGAGVAALDVVAEALEQADENQAKAISQLLLPITRIAQEYSVAFGGGAYDELFGLFLVASRNERTLHSLLKAKMPEDEEWVSGDVILTGERVKEELSAAGGAAPSGPAADTDAASPTTDAGAGAPSETVVTLKSELKRRGVDGAKFAVARDFFNASEQGQALFREELLSLADTSPALIPAIAQFIADIANGGDVRTTVRAFGRRLNSPEMKAAFPNEDSRKRVMNLLSGIYKAFAPSESDAATGAPETPAPGSPDAESPGSDPTAQAAGEAFWALIPKGHEDEISDLFERIEGDLPDNPNAKNFARDLAALVAALPAARLAVEQFFAAVVADDVDRLLMIEDLNSAIDNATRLQPGGSHGPLAAPIAAVKSVFDDLRSVDPSVEDSAGQSGETPTTDFTADETGRSPVLPATPETVQNDGAVETAPAPTGDTGSPSTVGATAGGRPAGDTATSADGEETPQRNAFLAWVEENSGRGTGSGADFSRMLARLEKAKPMQLAAPIADLAAAVDRGAPNAEIAVLLDNLRAAVGYAYPAQRGAAHEFFLLLEKLAERRGFDGGDWQDTVPNLLKLRRAKPGLAEPIGVLIAAIATNAAGPALMAALEGVIAGIGTPAPETPLGKFKAALTARADRLRPSPLKAPPAPKTSSLINLTVEQRALVEAFGQSYADPELLKDLDAVVHGRAMDAVLLAVIKGQQDQITLTMWLALYDSEALSRPDRAGLKVRLKVVIDQIFPSLNGGPSVTDSRSAAPAARNRGQARPAQTTSANQPNNHASAGKNNRGADENEDAAFEMNVGNARVAAVLDGVSRSKGAAASRQAKRALQDALQAALTEALSNPIVQTLEDDELNTYMAGVMNQALAAAIAAIGELNPGATDADEAGSATTALIAIVVPRPGRKPIAFIACAGDSAAYRVGRLGASGRQTRERLTVPDFVARPGQPTILKGAKAVAALAAAQPKRNENTVRAGLRRDSVPRVVMTVQELDEGDLLVLATDGLTQGRTDEDFLSDVAAARAAHTTMRAVAEAAVNNAPPRDDRTVVIVSADTVSAAARNPVNSPRAPPIAPSATAVPDQASPELELISAFFDNQDDLPLLIATAILNSSDPMKSLRHLAGWLREYRSRAAFEQAWNAVSVFVTTRRVRPSALAAALSPIFSEFATMIAVFLPDEMLVQEVPDETLMYHVLRSVLSQLNLPDDLGIYPQLLDAKESPRLAFTVRTKNRVVIRFSVDAVRQVEETLRQGGITLTGEALRRLAIQHILLKEVARAAMGLSESQLRGKVRFADGQLAEGQSPAATAAELLNELRALAPDRVKPPAARPAQGPADQASPNGVNAPSTGARGPGANGPSRPSTNDTAPAGSPAEDLIAAFSNNLGEMPRALISAILASSNPIAALENLVLQLQSMKEIAAEALREAQAFLARAREKFNGEEAVDFESLNYSPLSAALFAAMTPELFKGLALLLTSVLQATGSARTVTSRGVNVRDEVAAVRALLNIPANIQIEVEIVDTGSEGPSTDFAFVRRLGNRVVIRLSSAALALAARNLSEAGDETARERLALQHVIIKELAKAVGQFDEAQLLKVGFADQNTLSQGSAAPTLEALLENLRKADEERRKGPNGRTWEAFAKSEITLSQERGERAFAILAPLFASAGNNAGTYREQSGTSGLRILHSDRVAILDLLLRKANWTNNNQLLLDLLAKPETLAALGLPADWMETNRDALSALAGVTTGTLSWATGSRTQTVKSLTHGATLAFTVLRIIFSRVKPDLHAVLVELLSNSESQGQNFAELIRANGERLGLTGNALEEAVAYGKSIVVNPELAQLLAAEAAARAKLLRTSGQSGWATVRLSNGLTVEIQVSRRGPFVAPRENEEVSLGDVTPSAPSAGPSSKESAVNGNRAPVAAPKATRNAPRPVAPRVTGKPTMADVVAGFVKAATNLAEKLAPAQRDDFVSALYKELSTSLNEAAAWDTLLAVARRWGISDADFIAATAGLPVYNVKRTQRFFLELKPTQDALDQRLGPDQLAAADKVIAAWLEQARQEGASADQIQVMKKDLYNALGNSRLFYVAGTIDSYLRNAPLQAEGSFRVTNPPTLAESNRLFGYSALRALVQRNTKTEEAQKKADADRALAEARSKAAQAAANPESPENVAYAVEILKALSELRRDGSILKLLADESKGARVGRKIGDILRENGIVVADTETYVFATLTGVMLALIRAEASAQDKMPKDGPSKPVWVTVDLKNGTEARFVVSSGYISFWDSRLQVVPVKKSATRDAANAVKSPAAAENGQARPAGPPVMAPNRPAPAARETEDNFDWMTRRTADYLPWARHDEDVRKRLVDVFRQGVLGKDREERITDRAEILENFIRVILTDAGDVFIPSWKTQMGNLIAELRQAQGIKGDTFFVDRLVSALNSVWLMNRGELKPGEREAVQALYRLLRDTCEATFKSSKLNVKIIDGDTFDPETMRVRGGSPVERGARVRVLLIGSTFTEDQRSSVSQAEVAPLEPSDSAAYGYSDNPEHIGNIWIARLLAATAAASIPAAALSARLAAIATRYGIADDVVNRALTIAAEHGFSGAVVITAIEIVGKHRISDEVLNTVLNFLGRMKKEFEAYHGTEEERASGRAEARAGGAERLARMRQTLLNAAGPALTLITGLMGYTEVTNEPDYQVALREAEAMPRELGRPDAKVKVRIFDGEKADTEFIVGRRNGQTEISIVMSVGAIREEMEKIRNSYSGRKTFSEAALRELAIQNIMAHEIAEGLFGVSHDDLDRAGLAGTSAKPRPASNRDELMKVMGDLLQAEEADFVQGLVESRPPAKGAKAAPAAKRPEYMTRESIEAQARVVNAAMRDITVEVGDHGQITIYRNGEEPLPAHFVKGFVATPKGLVILHLSPENDYRPVYTLVPPTGDYVSLQGPTPEVAEALRTGANANRGIEVPALPGDVRTAFEREAANHPKYRPTRLGMIPGTSRAFMIMGTEDNPYSIVIVGDVKTGKFETISALHELTERSPNGEWQLYFGPYILYLPGVQFVGDPNLRQPVLAERSAPASGERGTKTYRVQWVKWTKPGRAASAPVTKKDGAAAVTEPPRPMPVDALQDKVFAMSRALRGIHITPSENTDGVVKVTVNNMGTRQVSFLTDLAESNGDLYVAHLRTIDGKVVVWYARFVDGAEAERVTADQLPVAVAISFGLAQDVSERTGRILSGSAIDDRIDEIQEAEGPLPARERPQVAFQNTAARDGRVRIVAHGKKITFVNVVGLASDGARGYVIARLDPSNKFETIYERVAADGTVTRMSAADAPKRMTPSGDRRAKRTLTDQGLARRHLERDVAGFAGVPGQMEFDVPSNGRLVVTLPGGRTQTLDKVTAVAFGENTLYALVAVSAGLFGVRRITLGQDSVQIDREDLPPWAAEALGISVPGREKRLSDEAIQAQVELQAARHPELTVGWIAVSDRDGFVYALLREKGAADNDPNGILLVSKDGRTFQEHTARRPAVTADNRHQFAERAYWTQIRGGDLDGENIYMQKGMTRLMVRLKSLRPLMRRQPAPAIAYFDNLAEMAKNLLQMLSWDQAGQVEQRIAAATGRVAADIRRLVRQAVEDLRALGLPAVRQIEDSAALAAIQPVLDAGSTAVNFLLDVLGIPDDATSAAADIGNVEGPALAADLLGRPVSVTVRVRPGLSAPNRFVLASVDGKDQLAIQVTTQTLYEEEARVRADAKARDMKLTPSEVTRIAVLRIAGHEIAEGLLKLPHEILEAMGLAGDSKTPGPLTREEIVAMLKRALTLRDLVATGVAQPILQQIFNAIRNRTFRLSQDNVDVTFTDAGLPDEPSQGRMAASPLATEAYIAFMTQTNVRQVGPIDDAGILATMNLGDRKTVTAYDTATTAEEYVRNAYATLKSKRTRADIVLSTPEQMKEKIRGYLEFARRGNVRLNIAGEEVSAEAAARAVLDELQKGDASRLLLVGLSVTEAAAFERALELSPERLLELRREAAALLSRATGVRVEFSRTVLFSARQLKIQQIDSIMRVMVLSLYQSVGDQLRAAAIVAIQA